MRHRLFFTLLCSTTLAAAPALADAGHDAFSFADKKAWSQAMASAKQDSAVLHKVITWLYLQDADAGPSFDEITSFIEKNPDWPRQERLRLRAEQSLRTSTVPDAQLKRWFTAHPPVSGIGKVKWAEVKLRSGATLEDADIRTLLREAWKIGDFEEPEERRMLAVYGDLFTKDDHFARADRLLWEERSKAALRLSELLSSSQQALIRARAALQDDNSDAAFRLSNVPSSMMDDPGLLYARIQWRLRRGDDDGVRELLLDAPAHVPYPKKWWRAREMAIREAIAQGHYSQARRLLKNHGQTDSATLADAIWLSGWLELEFEHEPAAAYQLFYNMYENVSYPVSRARAAYWAARAAEKSDDQETAKSWYASAAAYPTTFYGQVAALKLYGTAPLKMPAAPEISAAERKQFEESELAQAVRECAQAGGTDTATLMLYHLIDEAKTPAQAALAANLATQVHSEALGVRGAKRAMQQQNVVLPATGYPKHSLAAGLPLPSALIYAIIRQESEFDPRAKSSAGAMGFMQLGAATAKDTAKKIGMKFAPQRLYEPSYNIQLGSAYLARLIKVYDDSNVLAIAAYNAGPGNVRKWMAQFGRPSPSDMDATINWLEKIPFAETRNYVQRVMENWQVYRHLLAAKGREAPQLSLAEELK